MKDSLDNISIRGRMAVAIMCLQTMLEHWHTEKAEKESLINIFWQFVEIPDLMQWAIQIDNDQLINEIVEFVTEEESIPIRTSVQTAPHFLLKAVCIMIDLGMEEFYGRPPMHSPLTKEYLIRILELMLENGFSIPLTEPFLKLKYTKQDPWGKAVSREIFSNNS